MSATFKLCLSTCLGFGVLFISTICLADDRAELKVNVKWAIWHEGCRVFANDNNIGKASDLRQCFYNVQAHNQRAQDLIAHANDDLLLAVVRESVAEIPGEFQLRENFAWVCYHEGQMENFRVMKNNGNFEGIRSIYSDKQDHNPNTRNLLAAVSNQDVGALIDSL